MPDYTKQGLMLGQAIFGKPQDPNDYMKSQLMAQQARKYKLDGDLLMNKGKGQQMLYDQLTGINGDLNNVDGGNLSAALALSGITNPGFLSATSLDPRMNENAQRRIHVSAGRAASLGEVAAGIEKDLASAAYDRARINADGTVSDSSHKPPTLRPDDSADIQAAAIEAMGLDGDYWPRTVAANPDLSTAIMQTIADTHKQELGNAAATQAAVQSLLSSVLRKGEGGELSVVDGPNRYWGLGPDDIYDVDTDLLSQLVGGGQPVLPAQPSVQAQAATQAAQAPVQAPAVPPAVRAQQAEDALSSALSGMASANAGGTRQPAQAAKQKELTPGTVVTQGGVRYIVDNQGVPRPTSR